MVQGQVPVLVAVQRSSLVGERPDVQDSQTVLAEHLLGNDIAGEDVSGRRVEDSALVDGITRAVYADLLLLTG